MSDLNIVIMSGRVTKVPEVRATSGGKEVGGLSIESVETWNGGERKEFVRVIGWGDMAQQLMTARLNDYVLVQGKWSSRSWEDKTTGAKQRTVELNARSITIIGDAGGGKPDADDPDFDFN